MLRRLPAEQFDATESATPRVDAKSLVTVRQNRYFAAGRARRTPGRRADRRARDHEQPRRPSGRAPRAPARQVRHQRAAGPLPRAAGAQPGGLEHSLALAKERQRGGWPAAFDELWAALADRYGRSEAARQMVDVLMLCREHGPDRVVLVVRGALAAGAHDGRAVACSPAAPRPLARRRG